MRQVLSIETELAKCVNKLGGQVLDEVLKQPNFKNADYWFPEYKTVAELKRLDEDLSAKEDFQKKVTDLYSSWVQRGLMPEFTGKMTLNLQKIPQLCAHEYIEIIKKRIENSIIKKANHQIRETKNYYEDDSAKGLLIIANDGNPMLKLDFMAHLLSRILKNQYSSINSVIYFSANLAVRMPFPELQMSSNRLWADCVLGDREPAPKNLRENLQEAWMKNYSTLFPDELIHEILMSNDRNVVEKIYFGK
jgi:hypothetical protein